MQTLQFMKEVIRANRSTGAIGPSSPALAEKVTDMARVHEGRVVVEFGPGNGVFTEVIQRKLRPDAHFIAMEVNPEFVQMTRKRCPGVKVYHDSAQNALQYLREAGYDHCDTIVSGLPWTRFDEPLQDEIIHAAHDMLCPGGRFATFAYATSPAFPSGRRFFKQKLREVFPNVVRSRKIWKNIPPCVVYMATKT